MSGIRHKLVFMLGLNQAPHAFLRGICGHNLTNASGSARTRDDVGTRARFRLGKSQISNLHIRSSHTGPLDPCLQSPFLSPGPILVNTCTLRSFQPNNARASSSSLLFCKQSYLSFFEVCTSPCNLALSPACFLPDIEVFWDWGLILLALCHLALLQEPKSCLNHLPESRVLLPSNKTSQSQLSSACTFK